MTDDLLKMEINLASFPKSEAGTFKLSISCGTKEQALALKKQIPKALKFQRDYEDPDYVSIKLERLRELENLAALAKVSKAIEQIENIEG